MTIMAEVLRDFAEREPDRVAVTLQHPDRPDFHITCRELAERANDYAAAYARGGVKPGDMVILVLPHGRDIVYSFWGAILYGAVPSIMPFLTEKLSPDRYRAQLRALFSIYHPSALVTYPEFAASLLQLAEASPSGRWELLITDRIPRADALDFSVLPGLSRKETDMAYLQHSSGSTGLQKGIALSHRTLFRHLGALTTALSLTRDDVMVSWLPLYHAMGLNDNFLMPILSGIRVVQISPFDWVREPWRLLRAISDYRGTLTFLPNFAYHFCANKIRERDIEGLDLSSWRTSINGSEPVKLKGHQIFYERFKSHGLRLETLQTGYGLDEAVDFVTLSANSAGRLPSVEEVDRESLIAEGVARPASAGRPPLALVSCGRPLPDTAIRIVGDDGRDLPERHVGEIILKSDCLLSEYYNRPDLLKQAFLEGGWFKSGDYGYMSRGEVFFTGRKKDLIIVGGKNIYPQDLEELAGEVPGVHPGRTAAFGLFDEEQGTESAAIVAEVDAADPGERERIENAIRDHVTANSAVTVRHVRAVGPRWILKTSSGKIARSANKEKFIREFQGGPEAVDEPSRPALEVGGRKREKCGN